jgi:hypothetical protein
MWWKATDLFSAPPGSMQVEPPSAPNNRVLTGLVVGVVTIFALYFGKDVLLSGQSPPPP